MMAGSAAAAFTGASAGTAHAAVPASPAVTYTNTLAEQRADPHIWKHTDGFYYFTATVPAYDRIVLRRATTIQGLSSAAETTLWTRHASGVMGAHIWAPEIHFVDGKWYVYFAAGDADNVWRIRPYVLECTAADPLTGTWA
ncbi:family 43 glycosylhydrolase, partial [Streptomyces sp. NPDC005009]